MADKPEQVAPGPPQPFPHQNGNPPPVPPLPPEIRGPNSRSVPPPMSSNHAPQPPPPPPKPHNTNSQQQQQDQAVREISPMPPHPNHQNNHSRSAEDRYGRPPPDPRQHVPHYMAQPHRVNSLRNEHTPAAGQQQHFLCSHRSCDRSVASNGFTRQSHLVEHMKHHHGHTRPMHEPQSPVSPVDTAFPQASISSSFAQSPPPSASYQHFMSPTGTLPEPIQPQHQLNTSYPQPTQPPRQHVPIQQQTQKPNLTEDLLTSPFDNPLLLSSVDIAPPPVPPNPQKDALLQLLSQTLTQQVQITHNSNMSAIPPLQKQQRALSTTLSKIDQEMSQLNSLNALLDSNEKILHQAMRDADNVLEDAKKRDVPAVEDVLVAPTVVAKQLYDVVIEEKVLEESRGIVGKALDRGRIGADVWAKQTRSLAREEFRKKALVKKIAQGMGLVEEIWE
ncbi:MAG: hypothetical protein Q9190_002697 [Brigantiaea leucoxantha]